MKLPKPITLLIILVAAIAVPFTGKPQTAGRPSASTFPISGQVVDSITGKTLSHVNVTLGSDREEVLTDSKGRFAFKNVSYADSIYVKSLGYNSLSVSSSIFTSGKRIKLRLSPSTTELQEVVVTKTRNKYSKKNNPAVDLMQLIRKTYQLQDPMKQPFYSFDRYEKIVLGLNNFHKEQAGWLSKQLNPIEDFIDTARISGKPVLNISVREKVGSSIHSSNPDRSKQIVKGFRSVGIDESLNQENIQIMLEDVLREVDIFRNDVTLMQNRFVSPLSSIGADYYKYFLGDTAVIDGHKCVELIFVPHNPQSFSFNGGMYVDIEDAAVPFIRSLNMRIPQAMNINFVKNIFIEQKFERDSLGNRKKIFDDMAVELQLLPGLQGFYATRKIEFSNFSYSPTEDFPLYIDEPGNLLFEKGYDRRPPEFWQMNRSSDISAGEMSVDRLADRLDAVPLFYWLRKGIDIIIKGYVGVGNPSKFDIGPINTLISGNTIEGVRLRLGGMTTAALSPHLFARGYAAYGTRDRKWKYHGEVEYSFTAKKNHSREFPMNSIRLEHTHDLDMIGQHYMFTNADNVFLTLKRKDNNLGTYRSVSKLSYFYEHACGLTVNAGIKMERQTPTQWLPFIDGNGTVASHYNQSSLFLDILYSPGATFIQTASNRLPVNMDSWVFRITHEYGPEKMLGAAFTTNKTGISVQKRFWFSSFGYMDMLVKGEKIWSRVQYPALTWPNANLSYTIQPESYSLMNPMEFANDAYAAWDLTYWLNGLLFNRIPYISSLKLREVVTFKGLWGHLSKKNNPQYNPDLYRFPADCAAKEMGNTPYMELSVGIDNILSIIRLDYVWRLSYRHTPGAPDSGVRIALHFSF